MFFISQLIGLFVITTYSPEITQSLDSEGNPINVTTYNLPFGTNPPEDITPKISLLSIVFAIAVAVAVIFLLMRLKAEIFLRIWFFIVVILALGVSLNAFLIKIPYAQLIAIVIAVPLAIYKVFKRNILIHNTTELLIYPGIAAIFVPLLSLWTAVRLLIIISLYDMWAVWHSGIMQKMAKYQMEQVKVFPGFFIPYLSKNQKTKIKLENSKVQKTKLAKKGIKVPVAILGGGDVVFPMILAGVVLYSLGFIQAIIVSIGATIALAFLFKISEKGKFYPAMPFISAGALLGLGIALLI